jgi:hypothetical protein
MKLQQQLPDSIHAQLIEVMGISSLVFFGLIMVFFGWLKYKDRNNPAKKKRKGSARSAKKN